MKNIIRKAIGFATCVMLASTALAAFEVVTAPFGDLWPDDAVVTNVVQTQVEPTYAETTNIARSVVTAMKPVKLGAYLWQVEPSHEDWTKATNRLSRAYPSYRPGCTGVATTRYHGRNLDWTYDRGVSFVVRTPATEGRYASIGIVDGASQLTDAFMASGRWSDSFDSLTFTLADGINECGVVVQQNVLQRRDDKSAAWRTNSTNRVICFAIVRYALDRCATAYDAAMLINEKVFVPSEFPYDFHYQVSDATGTYVVEDGQVYASSDEMRTDVMTNFRLGGVLFNDDGTVDWNTVETYGIGVERYERVRQNGYDKATLEGMKATMQDVWYTKTYKEDTSPFWYTEQCTTGTVLTVANARENPTVFAPIVAVERAMFEQEHDVDSPLYRGGHTWQTTHMSLYDRQELTLRLWTQEDASSERLFYMFPDRERTVVTDVQTNGHSAVSGGVAHIVIPGGMTTNDVKSIASSESVTNQGAKAYADGKFFPKSGGVLNGSLTLSEHSSVQLKIGNDDATSPFSVTINSYGDMVSLSRYFSFSTGGTTSFTSYLYPDGTLIATHDAITNTYPILFNSYTKGAIDGITVTNGGAKAYSDATFLPRIADKNANRTAITIGERNVEEEQVVGQYSTVFGDYCVASGDYSRADGCTTEASGEYSHAEGISSTASGQAAHAEGFSNAIGECAHSEGSGYATGECSHAEGSGTSSGNYSHAEGKSTTSTGQYSHAEGCRSKSSGNYSHSEGNGCTASGECSHAEGSSSTSLGNYSHADGVYSRTVGHFSYALGYRARTGSSDTNRHDRAYAWSGISSGVNDFYNSNGPSTYNINPTNGISGFYIGSRNLKSYLDEKAPAVDGGYLPNIGGTLTGSLNVEGQGGGDSAFIKIGKDGQSPGFMWLNPYGGGSVATTYNDLEFLWPHDNESGDKMLMRRKDVSSYAFPKEQVYTKTAIVGTTVTNGGAKAYAKSYADAEKRGKLDLNIYREEYGNWTDNQGDVYTLTSKAGNVLTWTRGSDYVKETLGVGAYGRWEMSKNGRIAVVHDYYDEDELEVTMSNTGGDYWHLTRPYYIRKVAESDNHLATESYVGSAVGGLLPLVTDVNGKKTAVTVGSRLSSDIPKWSNTNSYLQGLAVWKNEGGNKKYYMCVARQPTVTNTFNAADWKPYMVGPYSFVVGTNCWSGIHDYGMSEYCHSEGYQTYSEGLACHVEGERAIASGYYTHAEGIMTYASGTSAHAEGIKSDATNHVTFVWSGDYAVKPGTQIIDRNATVRYGSHGNGTFNVNPKGGTDGFWVGSTNLTTILAGKADAVEGGYVPRSGGPEHHMTDALWLGDTTYITEGEFQQVKIGTSRGGSYVYMTLYNNDEKHVAYEEDIPQMLKLLTGKSFDLSNQDDFYRAVSNIITVLGGTVTKMP